MTVRREQIWIPGRMPGLNDIIAWRACKYKGEYSEHKRKWQGLIRVIAQRTLKPWPEGAHFEYELVEPNKKRDPSNACAGAQKFIEDALVEAGILPNDGWRHVLSVRHSWTVHETAYGVRVTLWKEVPGGQP